MDRIKNVTRFAVSLLLGILVASGASAQGNRHGSDSPRNGNSVASQRGHQNQSPRAPVNNGNQYGRDTRPVSVPEPGALGLFGAAAAALGLSAFLRRRKNKS